MKLTLKKTLIAVGLAVAASSASAALIGSQNNCAPSMTSVKIGTNTADACFGFYSGNVNTGSAATGADVQAAAIAALGSAYTGSVTQALANVSPLNGATTATFAGYPLVGDVLIGLHWGQNNTAFYFWDNLSGTDGNIFTFPTANPLGTGGGASSNIFLYAVGSGGGGNVPLPGSLALLGLGALAAGVVARKR